MGFPSHPEVGCCSAPLPKHMPTSEASNQLHRAPHAVSGIDQAHPLPPSDQPVHSIRQCWETLLDRGNRPACPSAARSWAGETRILAPTPMRSLKRPLTPDSLQPYRVASHATNDSVRDRDEHAIAPPSTGRTWC